MNKMTFAQNSNISKNQYEKQLRPKYYHYSNQFQGKHRISLGKRPVSILDTGLFALCVKEGAAGEVLGLSYQVIFFCFPH